LIASIFGRGVALSYDGDFALLGERAYAGLFGEGSPQQAYARLFTRSGSTWTQRAEQLRCGVEEQSPYPEGACSVALSGDASTALVGTAVYVKPRARHD
jgi:hypothetical protein